MARALSDWLRIVLHADMDAFYAAVEQLDDPSLRGKPVLVGSPGARGVVLTASYEARPFGVGSAMAMVKARRQCPDAIIVPPRFDRYQEVSKTIMDVFGDFSPDVEAISLDEAFLEMTGAEDLFGAPGVMGQKLKAAVREATGGLSVSVGASGTKYVAKVASAHRKPDGLTVVPPTDAKVWLAPLPVSRLWGAGRINEARLHRLGLMTIGDVATADPDWLSQKLGSAGRHFYALANAEDPRAVASRRASKSVGSERTLAKDVSDRQELKRHLRRSADDIGRRLRRKRIVAFGVRIKLKTTNFQLLTRQHLRQEPTDVAEQLYTDAAALLDAFKHPGPFRLVGMAAYDLAPAGETSQFDLFGSGSRWRKLETAIDELANRFGPNVLRRADELNRRRQSPNLDFLDDDDEQA
ncbi:MAG: DNA polymerase IV [Proteobacteria bacterium]|nr:DNA polymerase IV [Pseudomonadota bacterium]